MGPAGYGSNHFIRADSLLPYTIHFENETNATAPAQRVVLSNHLTNRLDWTTFELTEIAFGDHFIAVPPHTQHFEHTVKLRQNGFEFEVQIVAGIHLDTGEVYARFQSLNPTNGLPPPVDIGLLPPEDGTGRGQGRVSYVIRPKSDLPTGTEIRNVAYIVFDQQPAIATDWVDPHDPGQGIDTNKQALVTIDADPPTSAVLTLPAEVATPFQVQWAGDDGPGAGIVGYDVQVAEVPAEGALDWKDWQLNTLAAAEVFEGGLHKTYAFRCRARDGVGYVEDWLALADAETIATTQIQTNRPPVITAISNQTVFLGGTLNLPILATDPDEGQTLTYELLQRPAGMGLTDTNWIRWTPNASQLGDWDVEMKVKDDGVPALSDTKGLQVTVRTLDVTVTRSDGGLEVSFPTVAGRRYRIEFTDDLGTPAWQTLDPELAATGSPHSVMIPILPDLPLRFYRIVEVR